MLPRVALGLVAKLSVAIMAVPSRSENVNKIIRKLGVRVPVFYDTERRGPWFNARRAWGSVKSGATHHLVLQDDVLLCGNFIKTVEHLCSLRPDQILNLFSLRKIVAEAKDAETSWVKATNLILAPAIVMPTPFIPRMLRWQDQNLSSDYLHDDGRIQMWMEYEKRPAYIPAPNIVEHIDGKSEMGHHTPLPRKSRWFIGENVDGMSVDWSKGFDSPMNLHVSGITAKNAKYFINAPHNP
jgi:hypothetical protein